MKNEISTRNGKRRHSLGRFKVFRALILAAGGLFLSIVLVLILFSMEETVRSRGVVEAAEVHELTTRVDAAIVAINVEEGAVVRAGETLVEFDASHLLDDIKMLENDVKELEESVEVKRKALDIVVQDPLPKEYRHAEIMLTEAQRRHQMLNDKLQRYRMLHGRDVISKTALETVEMEFDRSLADYQKAKEIDAKIKSGLAEKIVAKARDELDLLLTQLKNERTRLELWRRRVADYRIAAPVDGKVVAVPFDEGRYAEKGDVVLTLAETGRKRILARVDERDVARVEVGQKVRIISGVYNHLKFGYFHGEVERVRDLPVRDGTAVKYPVDVVVTDEIRELKLGSTADLSITTGRDRIIKVILGLNQW